MECELLSGAERKRLWGRIAIRLLGFSAVVLCCVLVLPPVCRAMFPFIVGLLVAWMLNPLIERIRNRVKIPRKLLSCVLTAVFVAVVGSAVFALIYALVNELVPWVQGWLDSAGTLSSALSIDDASSGLLALLPGDIGASMQDGLLQIMGRIEELILSLLMSLAGILGDFLSGIPSFLLGVFVFIMATYFVLGDFPAVRSTLQKCRQGRFGQFVGSVYSASMKTFKAYIKAQSILALCTFVIFFVGFLLIGQTRAAGIALILAVLDFIPVIGAGLVMVPWILIVLIGGNPLWATQLAAVLFAAAIFRKLMEPKVIGSQTGLSPLLTLLSIFVGLRITGLVGMLLGPIVLQIILTVVKTGVFDELKNDLQLLSKDISAFLMKKPPEKGYNHET